MSDKRVIEQPASEEIFHDDWILKDSPLHETTKIRASVFMALVVDEAKDGMVPYTMLATEWTALTTYYKDQVVIYNGELYRAKDTNVSPTFNPSAWTKISFDTLYRTTLANVKNSICEEWSTSGEYTLNDCAIHEDKLYKCVADTATVGTWVSSEWELVSIYEIIQNLPKSASYVTYDNTESGLESDNVQDALDEVAENIGEIEENISEITETITELSSTTEVTGTASGAIATFTDGADAPLKELKVTVAPYQDLSHGDPSPENICPIIGWNYTVLTVFNINIWDEEWESGKYSLDNGSKINDASTIRSKNYINVKPNTTFYSKMSSLSSSGAIAFWYDKNKTFINWEYCGNKSLTVPSNAYYMTFYCGSSYGTTYNNDISINYPSTDTEYHAYNGATYTIDLDGTRYGGVVDVLSGVLTVDNAEVDLGSLNYTYYSGNLFTVRISDLKPVPNEVLCDALCSIYVTKKGNEYSFIDGSFVAGFNNSSILAIHDSRFTDATAFKTAMNGVQLVYELATPITVQLAPTQVKSLEGTNNISANCGDINNVEYVRNLNITINDLLSRING